MKFVEVSGTREQLRQAMGSLLDAAGKAMTGKQPDGSSCNEEFVAAWKKRMAERATPDRFIEVIAAVYEKHLSADELDELTSLRVAGGQGKTRQPSKLLAEKLQKDAIDIQSEVMGATTQLGSRLGGEIGQEIEKEHPGWCTRKQ